MKKPRQLPEYSIKQIDIIDQLRQRNLKLQLELAKFLKDPGRIQELSDDGVIDISYFRRKE